MNFIAHLHLRTHGGAEVGLVLEDDAGRGILLHLGTARVPFAAILHAVPLSALWGG